MDTKVREYVEGLWWLFILQGIATLLFGVIALFMPGLTLASLVILFAIYIVVVGILELIHGFGSIGKNNSWWFALIVGLVLTGVGVYLIRHPDTALNAFIVLVGALTLARGIFDLVIAAFFVRVAESRWLWAISGVLSIVAGIIIWSSPIAGGIAFVWVLGLYALLVGSISLAYAFQVRVSVEALREVGEAVAKTTPAQSRR